MTFIVNILHRDFTLLAADKRANVDGPAIITMGNITIHTEKGATINGYKKIFVNQPRSFALGIAGTIQEHSYVSEIEASRDISKGMEIVRKHMEEFLNVDNRTKILETTTRTENQGISTFFDGPTLKYFTNLYLYSDIHNATRLYVAPDSGLQLFHVGSGSKRFEEAVGIDEINKFTSSAVGPESIEQHVSWLRDAFKKISAIEESVGEEFSAVISTRNCPQFSGVPID